MHNKLSFNICGMMIRPILICLLWLTLSFGRAQEINDTIIYYDSAWTEIGSKSEAVYYRVIKDFNSKQSSYEINDYYITGELQMHGITSDNKGKIKNSVFTWYYKNGNKKSESTYVKNEKTGNYYSWYENGTKEEESIYEKKNEETISKMINYWDSTGKQIIINGNGYYQEYDKAQVILQGKYKNGYKDSIWECYHGNGKLYYRDIFADGLFISGESYDKGGKKYNYTERFVMPYYPGGMNKLYEFVSKNIVYPKKAKKEGIEGRVHVKFCVGVDGKIEKAEVFESVHPLLDKEAIRIIMKIKGWEPGVNRGMNVPVWFQLPINFRLKDD